MGTGWMSGGRWVMQGNGLMSDECLSSYLQVELWVIGDGG